ncbi:hypothetical protein EGW08_001317 [Elysia chlorotica]|uniref:Uncharacterized protein n=1 Tax=Elysia chlorotica TaxID=188477 RepID=A0A3S1CF19_ELYCH|nr:hypothetical protein EGW08_001317 [Elysia chlorotica]
MEEAHIYKREKYLNLTKELRDAGYKAVIMPVEIGARGFIGSSAYDLLTKLSICGSGRTKAPKLLAEIAENSSQWIWSRRNEMNEIQAEEVSQLVNKKRKVDASKIFTVAEQQIPTVSQEPVKSLGRWYDSSMKDTRRGLETTEQATEGLLAINRCGLHGKYKVWCLQFMLIPKLLWPLLVYEICSTTVEAIEAKINKFTRRWLGVPPGLTDVAMYCRTAKLKLPLKSILEEYKCGKARLFSMLEDSDGCKDSATFHKDGEEMESCHSCRSS